MDQMSLFDFVEEDAMDNTASKLDVVKAEFIGTERTDWSSLFEGYDELYAIFNSSWLNMLYFKKAVKKTFDHGFIHIFYFDIAKVFFYPIGSVKVCRICRF